MPEGDTIFRAARALHTALAGRKVTRFETVLPRLARVDDQQPIAGRTIERVAAAGKNLIIGFSGDLHLRTHMRMSGSWHLYRAGERWKRRRGEMRIVIAAGDVVAVAFNVPVAEFHDARSLARQDDLRGIGPDFLAETFDVEEATRRMRTRQSDEIGNALLNQRLAAGAGNIYKSETLFLCGVNPFERISALSDRELRRILNVARKLLRHAANGESRERRWVYGRAGEPCRRCGTVIAHRKQGPDARGTHWCPRCQPPLG
jgi:endonuclease-8